MEVLKYDEGIDLPTLKVSGLPVCPKMYTISPILTKFGWFLSRRTYRQTWDFTAGGSWTQI